MIKVGINGFGRIGRLILRALLEFAFLFKQKRIKKGEIDTEVNEFAVKP